MKLEVGKFYRTRDGQKVGPIKSRRDKVYPFHGRLDDTVSPSFTKDGYYWRSELESPDDLIAEWVDEPAASQPAGPVRTITRKEIVPGSYKGPVHIYEADNDSVRLSVPGFHYKLVDLKNIIETLTEIADALEENEK